MADGGVLWVAYVVSQEKQQAHCSGVRFFFVVFSSMLRCSHSIFFIGAIIHFKSQLPCVSTDCQNAHSPAPRGATRRALCL